MQIGKSASGRPSVSKTEEIIGKNVTTDLI
jgi:hypothetical protein